MGTVGWLLVVAVGIALGFSVGRIWPGVGARITALERERDAAREELRRYRQDVTGHFQRTAELFDQVTSDYRSLYEHLATGSRQLSAIPGEATQLPLSEPERRRLAQPEHPAAGAADEPASQSGAAPGPLEDQATFRQPSADDPGPGDDEHLDALRGADVEELSDSADTETPGGEPRRVAEADQAGRAETEAAPGEPAQDEERRRA